MLIGVDFDNTIVCYDQAFHSVTLERGLIPAELPATKGSVRDYLRQIGREDEWTELQGHVYGARMLDASPFPGVLEFFSRCKQRRIDVCIISHRTRYPFRGPIYDLHQAAQAWLETYGFYHPSGIGISRQQVFFEFTKQEKLDRIKMVGCTHFVDDLPELLLEPGFPEGVERILFDPSDTYASDHRFCRVTSWKEIERILVDGSGLSQ